MRVALVLLALTGNVHADALPPEYEDLGACLVTEYVGPKVLRVSASQRDDKQRKTKESITFHGVTGTTSFSYDARGRLATTTDHAPSGDEVTTFEYGKVGKLSRVVQTRPSFDDAATWIRTYRVDAQGRYVGSTETIPGTPMKLERAYTYDRAGRIATIKIASMVSTMSYDANGLLARTEERDAANPKQDRVLAYRYDEKRRRIEATSATGRTDYRYDCNAAAEARPVPKPRDVRDKPGYCGRPNCGKPRD